MIAFAAVAVALAVACQIDEPSRPALPTVSRTVAPFDADSIHLTYVCGKRFRIRNENDFAADVTWDVVGSADSGRLTLPARPAGQPYSEVYISTNSIGLTRLRYQSQIIETSINVGTPCVVPALAPPTIPYALLLSLGQIDIGRGRRARPDVVMVVFRDGTPQSIRQAAVDAVGGLVVGGYPLVFRENAYYVLVPGQGTLKGLLDAVEILRALPAVSQAGFIDDDPGGGAAYRRPNDGGGFQEGNWRVSKQNADSTNWALEAIDAPLAWGCDTGTATVKVAVVDRSYTPGTEVDNNVAFPGYLPNAFGDNHGLRVASVLGAPGNNSAGITGIMWAVAIDFRERLADPNNYLQPMQRLPMVTVDDIILTEHLVAAGDAGAHIINLSVE